MKSEENIFGRNVFSKFFDKSCVSTFFFFYSSQSPTRLEGIMSMPDCNFSNFQLIIKSVAGKRPGGRYVKIYLGSPKILRVLVLKQ